MPRKAKKRSEGTDFTITDAAKRATLRRKQLSEAAGISSGNEIDAISKELHEAEMTDYERKVFEE